MNRTLLGKTCAMHEPMMDIERSSKKKKKNRKKRKKKPRKETEEITL